MIAAVLEKLGFVLAVVILLGLKMVNTQEAVTAFPDAVLLGFFLAAYKKTETPLAA
ncbi:hypothetical protein ACPOL_2876 [Acidisarcina polymorpha]|uniref:Uncharacterized protein n=2 Tax=Acidisarcina polymorpha TaxID=2211140 RepID=A0A2Z5FZN1_9BACT|nr:hypothetical protein ACPOL_2876 [Acidisarcina polymorpha]